MEEPSRHASRQVLGGAAIAALALLGGGFALGRATSERPVPTPTPVARPAPGPTRAPPVSVAPLGRTELLAAVAEAADAYASGDAVGSDEDLDGRRFELRLPFGCRGPAPGNSSEPLRWSYDEEAQALRFSIQPTGWPLEEWAPAPADAENPVEAIQGFWIARPWTDGEGCPPVPNPSPAPAPTSSPSPSPTPSSSPASPTLQVTTPPAVSLLLPPERTVGIAQFFTSTGPRTMRRDGEPFEAVKKVAPDALNAVRGFRLVLRGRIGRTPDGRSVACRAVDADRRPTCLVAAEVDALAIENPATGEIVAEWRS